MRIAIDAMGGDHAPQEIIKGVVEAVQEHGTEAVLVGREVVLRPLLAHYPNLNSSITVVNAPQVIGYRESPTRAVRAKPDSSIVVGMNLLKSGEVSAFLSAGATGAMVCAALWVLGKVPKIDRPALGCPLPTPRGHVLVLDVGANADCRPDFLVQFAQMGTIYARELWGIDRPRVGLLSTGEEETKGNRLVRESYGLLKKARINFIGNVEGHDVCRGGADVVVTDGFTGNVMLKAWEGLGESLLQALTQTTNSSPDLAIPELRSLKDMIAQRADYSEQGGAILLGVKGNVIVAHGRSRAKAIKNAVRLAQEMVKTGVAKSMMEEKL